MDKFKDILNNIGGKTEGDDKKTPTPEEFKQSIIDKANAGIQKSIKKIVFAIGYIFAEVYVIMLLGQFAFKENYVLDYWQTMCMVIFVRLTMGSYKNKNNN